MTRAKTERHAVRRCRRRLEGGLRRRGRRLSRAVRNGRKIVRRRRTALDNLRGSVGRTATHFGTLRAVVAGLRSGGGELLRRIRRLGRSHRSNGVDTRRTGTHLRGVRHRLQRISRGVTSGARGLRATRDRLSRLRSGARSTRGGFRRIRRGLRGRIPSLDGAAIGRVRRVNCVVVTASTGHQTTGCGSFLSSLPSSRESITLQTKSVLFSNSVTRAVVSYTTRIASVTTTLCLNCLSTTAEVSRSNNKNKDPNAK